MWGKLYLLARQAVRKPNDLRRAAPAEDEREEIAGTKRAKRKKVRTIDEKNDHLRGKKGLVVSPQNTRHEQKKKEKMKWG